MSTETVETVVASVLEGAKDTGSAPKRKMIPVKEFIAAYQASVKAGHTMQQFADSVGLVKGSAISRVNNVRLELQERGLSKAQATKIMPALNRQERSGGNRAEYLDDLVKETVLAEVPETPETPENSVDSVVEG